MILVECKAVARSFGIFNGQAKAIEHRLKSVIDLGLDDVDDKIEWLKEHPKGTNYDITKFKYMVGLSVSAFPEFMPSKNHKYWLNELIPRTLTIGEFQNLLQDGINDIRYNLVPLQE